MKFITTRYYINFLVKITFVHLLLSVVLITGYSEPVLGQESLKRTVYIDARESSVKDILATIAKQAHLKFSYSTRTIDARKKIDFQSLGTVESMLQQLFGDQVMVMELAGQLLLLKSPPAISEEKVLTRAAITVSGVVIDESGQPMTGVNVVEKRTANGTVTDVDGKYSLSVGDEAVLVFSFVGYKTQEIIVGGRTTLNIELASDSKILDELVIVGYGEQSKKMLTTAISKVSSADIGTQVIVNPADALSGLSSGVQVQAGRGGYPGAPPAIRIRGVGTIGGSADVLFVVDGYPLQDADNFNQINPSDIESIEILKDAASAAIYGSRAANGVVIVTTKSGKAGKTNFDVSYYTGFQSVAKRYDMMNRDEFISTLKKWGEVYTLLSGLPWTNPVPGINRTDLPDTDWQNLIFRNGKIQDFQVSASGGSQNIKFLASTGYLKQEGTMRGTSYDRFTFRLNMDANLTSRFHIGASLAPSYSSQYRMPAAGQNNNTQDGNIGISLPNIVQSALAALPIIPERLPNGDYGTLSNSGLGVGPVTLFNPLQVTDNVTNRFQNYSFLGKVFFEYDLLKNLTARTTFGSTYSQINQNGYIPPFVATNNAGQANISNPLPDVIWAIERSSLSLNWLWENVITYKFDLGAEKNHHFTAMLFGSMQKDNYKQVSTNGKNRSYTNGFIDNPSSSIDLQGGVGYDLSTFVSAGGRLSYDYKNRYLLNVAIRRDGASKFGPNNRYAYFPSVSAAWRTIDEDFMKDLKGKLSDLKFRVSYGQTGNANIGSFNWANGIASGPYVFGGTRYLGSSLSGAANYDLTWEKNEQYDYGIDLGLLTNKIIIGVDYYTRNTSGMLLNRELEGIYGYSRNARTNVGQLRNTGIEFNVETNLKIKEKLGWSASYNFSANKNEVTDLGGPTALPAQAPVYGWNNTHQIVVGQPLGNINGYIVEGAFKTQEDLAKYPQWQGNQNKLGDWRIKDTNGDNRITELDRTTLGNGIPRYNFGTTQRFNYKSFDLTVMINGVAGVSVLNGNLRQILAQPGLANVLKKVVNNFYDPRDPNADVLLPSPVSGGPGNQATSRHVQDGSFIRFKNITLGYNLPAELISRLKLKRTRVYVSAQNLFTFTKYEGLNPEVSIVSGDSSGNTGSSGSTGTIGSGNSPVAPGVDQGAYPAIKLYTFGFNVNF